MFAAIAADATPKNVPRAEGTRRFSVALYAMRGLALTLAVQLGGLRFNAIRGLTSDASSPAFSIADRGESRITPCAHRRMIALMSALAAGFEVVVVPVGPFGQWGCGHVPWMHGS